MPWREVLPLGQRMQFITDWETGLLTMTELAEQYGVSRNTLYKWVARYEAEGADGLVDRSRRPQSSPTALDPRVVEAVIALRQRHPRWGPKKLLPVLAARDPDTVWPKKSTVSAWLKARHLVRSGRRRRPQGVPRAPRAPITAPNVVWTTDFKGQFRTGDGQYCYPLTLRDGFSRFVLRCDALPGCTYDDTRRRFEAAFAEYGLPERIRSDNGPPFAAPGLAGLSRLSVWWIRLGIVPERIAPGHPEQNGSHEQFHAVLKAETARPPAATAGAQQERFRRFCAEYNQERPHEALQQTVPARWYAASPRPFPSRVPPLEYPGHLEIRRVSPIGQISWRGRLLFVSGALAGEDVGLEEVDEGVWTVYFANVILGRLDDRRPRIQPMATFTTGRSASSAGSAPVTQHRTRR